MVQTYTPTVSSWNTVNTNTNSASSASGYYMTLGAVKVAWGRYTVNFTGTLSSAGAYLITASNFTLPTSFFSTIYTTNSCVSTVTNVAQQVVAGAGWNTTSVSNYHFFYSNTTATSNYALSISFIVIGA